MTQLQNALFHLKTSEGSQLWREYKNTILPTVCDLFVRSVSSAQTLQVCVHNPIFFMHMLLGHTHTLGINGCTCMLKKSQRIKEQRERVGGREKNRYLFSQIKAKNRRERKVRRQTHIIWVCRRWTNEHARKN